MKKNVVTIPMTINLRSIVVLGKVTRLASMTGSLAFNLEMVNTLTMVLAITAAKAMAEESISREVTKISESQVVMWVTVVTYQHESFSPTKTVVNLM